MISKSQIKYLKSLQIKKYRHAEQCFVVEGRKSVEELLQSDFQVQWLAADAELLERWRQKNWRLPPRVAEASAAEMAQAGTFQTNDGALAVAQMRPAQPPPTLPPVVLVLDDIRDPGNLGAIIRTADWFGITHVVASETTADFYNPKTIHASMGSFTRVQVFYRHLPEFLSNQKRAVYGAFLDGENVHQADFTTPCFMVVGNEANGISAAVSGLVTRRITIPRLGRAESLNAAIATAIVLDNLTRLKN
jgi:TrmH family RNA methyltransferase